MITAFNILLASPDLSAEEKEIVKGCRIQFIYLRNRVAGDEKVGVGEAKDLTGKLAEVRDMFQRDAADREPENAQRDMQALDEGGAKDGKITIGKWREDT